MQLNRSSKKQTFGLFDMWSYFYCWAFSADSNTLTIK